MKKALFALLVASFMATGSGSAYAQAYNLRQLSPGGLVFENARSGQFVLNLDEDDVIRDDRFIRYDDDFVGPIIDASKFTAQNGSSATSPTINAAINGTARFTTFTTGNSYPVSAAQMTSTAIYRPSAGRIVFEARAALTNSNSQVVHIGLNSYTTVNQPVRISGTAPVAVSATNFVGFVYDTSGSTAVWRGVGVRDTASLTTVASTRTPVANAYDTLRVVVDTSGNADFVVNNVRIGRAANAVSTTVLLAPFMSVAPTGSTARVMDLDYIQLQQRRQ